VDEQSKLLGDQYGVPSVCYVLEECPTPITVGRNIWGQAVTYYQMYAYYNTISNSMIIYLQNPNGSYRSTEQLHYVFYHEYMHYLDDYYDLADCWPEPHNYLFHLRLVEMGLWGKDFPDLSKCTYTK